MNITSILLQIFVRELLPLIFYKLMSHAWTIPFPGKSLRFAAKKKSEDIEIIMEALQHT